MASDEEVDESYAGKLSTQPCRDVDNKNCRAGSTNQMQISDLGYRNYLGRIHFEYRLSVHVILLFVSTVKKFIWRIINIRKLSRNC